MSAQAGEVHFGIAQTDPMEGKAMNRFKTPSRTAMNCRMAALCEHSADGSREHPRIP